MCTKIGSLITMASLFILLMGGCEGIILEKDITKKQVTLLAPSANLELDTLTVSFWWEKIEGASQYNLQVVSPSFATPSILLLDSTISSNKFTLDLYPGKFQWRVRALNNGYESRDSTGSFSINPGAIPSESDIKLELPANNTFIKTTTVKFEWEDAAADYYILEIDDNPEIIKNSNTSLSKKLPNGKTYKWKVIPVNAKFKTPSQQFTFTIDTIPPSQPLLTTPAENAIQTLPVTFSWQSSDDNLLKDELRIYKADGTTLVGEVFPVSGSESKVIDANDLSLENNTTYKWSVKSVDKSGSATTSDQRSFQIR